jgi:hypothetical protein
MGSSIVKQNRNLVLSTKSTDLTLAPTIVYETELLSETALHRIAELEDSVPCYWNKPSLDLVYGPHVR